MFKRVRQMKISLAAKCQILFGTAVAAIIFAALFVPWRRMEQLTEKLNAGAASAVASATVAEHVERMSAYARGGLLTPPPSVTTSMALAPSTQPAAGSASPSEPATFPAPRIVGIAASKTPERATKFELRSLARFKTDPNDRVETVSYTTKDGTEGFRYAEPLYATDRCIACHSPSSSQSSTSAPTLTLRPPASGIANVQTNSPTTSPTTAPARLAMLGIVSVDLPSQIKSKEVLLNRVFLLVAGMIAGSLAIIIFYLITTRLILQPVRVLQETAEKVSEGNLDIRSDINTGDEFQQLSETFNTMLFNLKTSADQLRAVNKSLDLKLGQLAESNVALYESNRLKSEFLANVSHELRTPLNSILGFAELLREHSGPVTAGKETKSSRYLSNIISSGNNLLDLINDLLDLAKIEAGRMEVRSEPISLVDLFEALVSLLKPLAERKDLRIVPNVGRDLPIVHTDPAKLQQVLYNFLSNAIKFSPDGSRIDLTAEMAAENAVRLNVIDQGPGIATDQQKIIFEKFRQLDGSATRQHGGTGLGLAISKELGELLGGKVGVDSAPGEGATFWITIPLAIEAGAADVRSKLVLT